MTHNPHKVVDTTFAILFLVRGRAPVIMNKLEYGEAVAPAAGTVQTPPAASHASAPAGATSSSPHG